MFLESIKTWILKTTNKFCKLELNRINQYMTMKY